MDINLGFNTSNSGYYFVLGKAFTTKQIIKLSADNFPLAVTYYPFTVSTVLSPVSFELNFDNNSILSNCQYVNIVKWSTNTFELTLLPCPILNFEYAEPILQKELTINNKNILVSICADSLTRVYLECENDCKFFSLPKGDYALDSYNKQNNNYIQLKSDSYLLILGVSDTINTLICDEFDKIDISNTFIKLYKTFSDTALHKQELIYSYSISGIIKVSDTYTCANILTAQSIPLAFFEALQLGQIDELKSYLSSDYEDVALSTLVDYFGEFDRILTPRLIYSPNTIALVNCTELKLVRLTLNNNKITNFNMTTVAP